MLFQWTFNGTNIPGATNATLTVTNLQAYNVGNYVAACQQYFSGSHQTPLQSLVSLLPVFSQYASKVLAAGPIDYWRFNDGETTYAYDYVGSVTIGDTDFVADDGTSRLMKQTVRRRPRTPASNPPIPRRGLMA